MKLSKLSKMSFIQLQGKYGTDSKIAKAMGVTRQAVGQARKKFDLPSPRIKIDPRNDKISNLYNRGFSVREISKTTKLSVSHIYRILKHKDNNQMELDL